MRLKKKNWYKKDDVEAVFFVPATPNGNLAEACAEEFRKAELKVKVIERAGTTMKKSLVRSNPFAERNCTRENCSDINIVTDPEIEIGYIDICSGVTSLYQS